jgi:hypothetical protein
MGRGMRALVHGAPLVVAEGNIVPVIPAGSNQPYVGEAVVEVAPRVEDGLFKYLSGGLAQASGRTDMPPGKGGVVLADFGSAERGAFSFRILTPERLGVGAIGLYFYEGRVGVLYAPLILDDPVVYSDASIPVFIERVYHDHAIELTDRV